MLAKNFLKALLLVILILIIGSNGVYAKGKGKKRRSNLTPEITKEIVTRSHYYGIDEMLLLEVMRQESSFNPNACSSANARGLMQFIPSTARRFGITNPHDVSQSVDAGCRYLGFLIRKFNGRLDLVLAGYNAGEHAVEKYGNRVPPFAETQNYVRTIIANYKRALAVKEAFIKQHNTGSNYKEQSVSISITNSKKFTTKPLTKKQIQQKLKELDNFSSSK